jgi:hypothetical protein
VILARCDDPCLLEPVFTRRAALTIHPALRPDLHEPILGCGDPSEVLPYVLFSDIADWDSGTIEIKDTDAKDAFGEKNSFCVHSESKIMPSGWGRVSKSLIPARQLSESANVVLGIKLAR